MNSRTRFLAILFAVSANNLASAESCNDKICNKEYSISEPIQRAVCKAFGASNPGVRDCLRAQRARTGGAKRDTFSKIVFRHVKCFARASAIRRRGAHAPSRFTQYHDDEQPSNGGMGKFVDDVPIATAILERFLADSELLQLNGRSFRLDKSRLEIDAPLLPVSPEINLEGIGRIEVIEQVIIRFWVGDFGSVKHSFCLR